MPPHSWNSRHYFSRQNSVTFTVGRAHPVSQKPARHLEGFSPFTLSPSACTSPATSSPRRYVRDSWITIRAQCFHPVSSHPPSQRLIAPLGVSSRAPRLPELFRGSPIPDFEPIKSETRNPSARRIENFVTNPTISWSLSIQNSSHTFRGPSKLNLPSRIRRWEPGDGVAARWLSLSANLFYVISLETGENNFSKWIHRPLARGAFRYNLSSALRLLQIIIHGPVRIREPPSDRSFRSSLFFFSLFFLLHQLAFVTHVCDDNDRRADERQCGWRHKVPDRYSHSRW